MHKVLPILGIHLFQASPMKESTEVVPSGWNMSIEKAQGGIGIMHADLGLTGDVREERGDEGLV